VHQQVKDAEHQARWTKIWNIIGGMQNLRELEVMLRITHPAWVDLDAETATVLFQSINATRQFLAHSSVSGIESPTKLFNTLRFGGGWAEGY
jgi:hypothetical protein